jgi:hypothetical protein
MKKLTKEQIHNILVKLENKTIDFEYLSNDVLLSDEFIEKFSDKYYLYWKEVSLYKYLSEEFIEKYVDKLNWIYVCRNQKLSDKLILKYSNKLNWREISEYNELNLDFIDKYTEKLDWLRVSGNLNFNITIDLILKYKDKICWLFVCKRQDLNKYSKEIQDLILQNIISNINRQNILHKDLTSYMIKKYKKYKIMI